ncbi:hypothetical protein AFB00_20815 [Pseudonocardia sp. HH130630-07]|nr:hypothetical protein AFB00_20815 [Pseudonocardia sp. HH130630-07]
MIVAPDRPVLDNAAVYVGEDGTIRDVGPEPLLYRRYPDVRRTAFPDATMLAGLINAHVHLAFDATPDPVATLRGGDPAAVRHIVAAHARELLDSGITTARDLGDRDGIVGRVRDEIAAGEAVGPRVLSAFAPLTSPQGHCWFLGGEVRDATQIRELIDRQADRGADLVKVMAGGGRLTPSAAPVWESQFTAG